MCIIIDINVLSKVFMPTDPGHKSFKPILDWIYNGKGKIVYGGTKYLKELGPKYQRLFLQFRNARKAIVANLNEVDCKMEEVNNLITDSDFDDPHLIALLLVTKCKLISTLDSRATPFIKSKTFFKASNRPKIYRNISNRTLLVDTNIADCCKPADKTTNQQKSILPNPS